MFIRYFFSLSILLIIPMALKANDDILFLAHFNDSITPEIAKGSGKPAALSQIETNKNAGLEFKKSISVPGGLDLNKRSSFIAYSASGNIDINNGTCQFWIKPESWHKNRYDFHRIFSLVYDTEKRNVMKTSSSFLDLTKSPKRWEINFINFRSWKNYKITADISNWEKHEWHQIAVTWQKGGDKALYLDGKLIGKNKYYPPKQEPVEFMFGSSRGGHAAKCSIDEFRILNKALSAEDIKKDYLRQSGGYEFIGGKKKKSTSELTSIFKSVPVKKTENNSHLYKGKPLKVYYTSHKINLDGDLKDPIWKEVKPIPALILRKGGMPKAKSEIKLLYDDKYLYFGCKFDEPKISKLRAAYDQHDLKIYNDDCLEILIDPKNSPESTFHFVANMIGGIYDSCNTNSRVFNARKAVSKGKTHSNFWTLEFAIPFSDIFCKTPHPGEKWGIRICRERKPVCENSSYPECSIGSFGSRSCLTRLEFMGNINRKSDLLVKLLDTKFLPGMNKIEMFFNNTGSSNKILALCVSALQNNKSSKLLEKKIILKGGNKKTITLALPVDSLAISKLAFNLKTDSKTAWCGSLSPAYSVPQITPAIQLFRLNNIQSDLLRWQNIHLPIAKAFQKSVNKLKDDISSFDNSIKNAIKTNTTIPAANCDKIAAAINGFDIWLNKRRMQIWQVNPWNNGSPSDISLKCKIPELKFRQGGNEWEFRAISICGLLPGGGKDYRLAVSDLYAQDGTRVNRANIHIYQAPYMRNNAGQLVTDPLIENDENIFTLLPGVTRRFWIALLSKNMKPGNYTGTITVKPVDIKSSPRKLWPVIKICVNVLRFKLPETHKWPIDTFLWHGGYNPVINEIPYLNFLHKHHINWVSTDRHRYDRGKPSNGTLRNRITPAQNKLPPGKEYFDPRNIRSNDEFLKAALAKKMNILFAWNICRNPKWIKLMTNHLLKLGFTYKQFMYSGMGDEFRANALPRYLPFHQKVFEMNPQIRWMSTFTSVPPPEGCTFEQFDQVVKYINTPIWFISKLWPKNQKRAIETAAWLKRHPELHPWVYQCSMGQQTLSPLAYYRFAPLKVSLVGCKGLALWSLTSFYGKPSIRRGRKVRVEPDSFFDQEDPDGKLFDGTCFYHPRKNVYPTKRFMALVEGLEDYAMVNMLRKKISSKSKYQELVSEKNLTDLIEQNNQKNVDSWRNKMLDALSKVYTK